MPEQPPPGALDVAVLIIVVGALLIGLISMAIGQLTRLYEYAVPRLFGRAGAVDMSSSGDAEPPPELVRTSDDLADTYQVEPGAAGSFQDADEGSDHDIISRRMAPTDLIVLLAVQRNDAGGFRWSKNQIALFVGGTRADVLKLIGEARGEQAQPVQPQQPRYRPLDEQSRPMMK